MAHIGPLYTDTVYYIYNIYTIETQTENFASPDDDDDGETDTKAAQNETKTKRTEPN